MKSHIRFCILGVKGSVMFLFILTLSFFACTSNSEPEYLNCTKLAEGIINIDKELVSKEIEILLTDTQPSVTSNDVYGHSKNINLLIDRINNSCKNVEAELICYACIETLPPQSEIKVSTDSSGTTIYRVIDISTSSEKRLSFVNIHEY